MIPIILSGGAGTRLWPYSRASYPKQFLPLVGDKTMLQETVRRLGDVGAPIVVCNQDHRFMVAEQLRSIGVQADKILLEPEGRNTAPAIALAALEILQKKDQLMLVLPADHVIPDSAAFQMALKQAEKAAIENRLVTFGIVPTYPETGYGYIKSKCEAEFQDVEEFLEKPNREKAAKYIESGDYFWNSGMFMFKASCLIDELEKYAPDIVLACRTSLAQSKKDLDFIRIDKDSFSKCPSDSVDYAVMEKTDRAAMVPLDAGWSDVGSWSSVWSILDKDDDGNAVRGDVIAQDTQDCFIQSQDTLVATIGIKDTVVIQTDDALLVAAKDKIQDVKDVVDRLKQLGRSESAQHRKVYRPWGHYDSVDSGDRFQVKRIVVKPGAKLSLQMHHHRAEHWVVVSGTAEVVNGDKTIMLSENQSTYIPIGVTHSLSNPGTIPLEIIEVQSGSYLGEDDIVRFEDIYGRS